MLDRGRFAALAASNTASLLAYAGIKVVLGWVVLELTSSALLVAFTFALLMLPRLLFGLHMGILIDRLDRRLATAGACLAAAGLTLILDWQSSPQPGLATVLVAAFVLGLLEALRLIAVQTLMYDVVLAERATAAMATSNFVGHLGQAVGGLVIGTLIALLESRAPLVVIAAVYLVGVVPLAFGERSSSAANGVILVRSLDGSALPAPPIGIASSGEPSRFRKSKRQTPRLAPGAIRSTIVDPYVRLLALFGVLLEILGFSSNALFPVLARDVYFVGASGLGAMNAVRSLGGALGLLALAWTATHVATIHRGFLLMGFAMLFGLALLFLGIAQGFGIALMMLFLVGVAAGSLDTLLQSLLQTVSEKRGSGMGVWVWIVGFGPIGQLEVGVIGTVLGAQFALGLNGLLLFGLCLVLTLWPATRRLA